MPRKGASSHRTKSLKETLNINQNIKKKRLKKKQQFADDQEKINSLHKRKPKIFRITYEIRNE